MNGMLGKLKFNFFKLVLFIFNKLNNFWIFLSGFIPNSHWQIESEIIRWLTTDNQINEFKSSGMIKKGYDLLENKSSVRSLLATDNFASHEMQRF